MIKCAKRFKNRDSADLRATFFDRAGFTVACATFGAGQGGGGTSAAVEGCAFGA